MPTARDWRSQSRFQVSLLGPVSETPLLELLNEKDPELLQNHYGKSSVVRGRYVSAATQRHRFPCFFGSPLAAHCQLSSGCFFTLELRRRDTDSLEFERFYGISSSSRAPVLCAQWPLNRRYRCCPHIWTFHLMQLWSLCPVGKAFSLARSTARIITISSFTHFDLLMGLGPTDFCLCPYLHELGHVA